MRILRLWMNARADAPRPASVCGPIGMTGLLDRGVYGFQTKPERDLAHDYGGNWTCAAGAVLWVVPMGQVLLGCVLALHCQEVANSELRCKSGCFSLGC